MSDIAVKFVIANLAAAAAILIVLALRKPVRAAFGARIAYALWLLAPLAALGSLIPPRVVEIVRPTIAPAVAAAPAPEATIPDLAPPPIIAPEIAPGFAPAPVSALDSAPSLFSSLDPWAIGALVWLIGLIATAAWLARNQWRFMADAREGFAGPAVAGFLRPRIITPADFEERFDLSEREVILAHEGIHISRNDARINAAVALARCVAWFNPLVHIGAHVMRIDQELACDATVVARHPRARAVYASALLKAQLAARPLPLGCYWPAGEDHPLTERIEMLKQAAPGRARRLAGAVAVMLLAAAAGAAAWASKPPETRLIEQPPTPAPATSPADQALRIVAVKHGLLEVRSPGGDKYVHRYFEPGESYAPRTGKGWTVSVDDGLAFEWRLGDQSLGLVDPAGGPVKSQSVDQTILRAPATSPQPIRFEPQQTPAAAQQQAAPQQAAPGISRDYVPPPLKLDVDAPLFLRGKVEAIDFGATSYVVRLRATGISNLFRGDFGRPWHDQMQGYVQPNTALWELSPTNLFGNADAIRADLMGKDIEVQGLNVNNACKPDCRIKAVNMFTPRSTEVPQPSPGDSLISFFTRWYDGGSPYNATGTIERIEFSDRTFDFYIRTPDRGPWGQSRLVQARSEYHHPRADIERELLGKTATATGWAARWPMGTFCAPICGMYAESIVTGDIGIPRARVTPDGPVLTTAIPAITPIQPPSHVLRIIALKRERLEISSRDVQKFVDRYLEPGEEYSTFGIGNGWTLSTPDGSAFEWRVGDTSLGPLTKSGPVRALNLDDAVKNLTPAIERLIQQSAPTKPLQPQPTPQGATPPKPQPTRYEPQQTPPRAPPPDIVAFATLFDADDPIQVRGKITKVDLTQPYLYVFVQASEATAPTPGATSTPTIFVPNTSLFRVMLGRRDGATDGLSASLVGKDVTIRGYRAKDKACTDACLMNGRDITVDGVKQNVTPGTTAPTPALKPIRYEPQQTPQQAPIRITSNASKYLQSEGRAVYTGNVQAIQGDFRLATDTLTVTCRSGASGQCDEIQALTAESNVIFTDADVSIRGDHADYDSRNGVIAFTGDVTSKRGNGEIVRSAKATYAIAGRKITVSGDRVTSEPSPN